MTEPDELIANTDDDPQRVEMDPLPDVPYTPAPDENDQPQEGNDDDGNTSEPVGA